MIKTRQKGLTLIEILITVVIMSIGLLGIASLQITGLKNNYSAYLRSQATVLATDIIDRMRVNRLEAINGNYDMTLSATPATATCEGISANCTVTALKNYDQYEWKNTLSSLLPKGNGSIATTTAGGQTTILVTVEWDDSRGQKSPLHFSVETSL